LAPRRRSNVGRFSGKRTSFSDSDLMIAFYGRSTAGAG
jgi:hypothetical protein